ncbi:O-linked N-acetylglucosamine transferase [Synechococcus sp. PCC 6312]|uniref:O-linked N-acetylglucosamine transferase, SPINDLY family protein n=1 Tax=Synechococcus sp. (strain ATCC 27167 / PCC 6312) TaxID=195253 RepID=UPI00029ED3AC|nr:O-linked N-acetylglucosamine transferase [Synechococcus sp. PCC 6312]AFY60485.1 putative O-linked N-acetylglucosamine transferase, SPINDLY family [Synechococcus sp. PCC 6312]
MIGLDVADQWLDSGHCSQAAAVYECLIAENPDQLTCYQNLGLAYLLQGEDVAAQVAWFTPLDFLPDGEAESYQESLLNRLFEMALHLESQQQDLAAWLVRQYYRQFQPENLINLIALIQLDIKLNKLTAESLLAWDLIPLLQEFGGTLKPETLEQFLLALFPCYPVGQSGDKDISQDMITQCIQVGLRFVPDLPALILKFSHLAYNHTYLPNYEAAIQLTQRCLVFSPENLTLWRQLADFQTDIGQFAPGLVAAQNYNQYCQTLAEKVFGQRVLMRALMRQGDHGPEVQACFAEQAQLIQQLLTDSPATLTRSQARSLMVALFHWPYVQDQPEQYWAWQKPLAALAQKNLLGTETGQNLAPYSYHQQPITTALKTRHGDCLHIGYLAHTLRQHSVGWLCRWLFRYHNRQKFKIHLYFLAQGVTPFTQAWFLPHADSWWAGNLPEDSVVQIFKDEIDLLIDLDGGTYEDSAEVLAYKPAPIQATWLGWDATGLPAVDYFIADPQVLPPEAEQYYAEKIWRLPEVYLAVDGFEIGVPTLRRADLDIPIDAVIYFTAQNGLKQHPETLKQQCQILAQVPNSYFLIKLRGEKGILRELFESIAQEEGVSLSRLRFVDFDSDELTHRANLQLADIVLDSYPYNGATTTLETLWLEIPLVTQVGQQFAARNSYTFMVNAGITEGIAWSAPEYVAWGIKLGQDDKLRQQVRQKLHQAKQTSPLWDTRTFTRHLEEAYQRMWTQLS